MLEAVPEVLEASLVARFQQALNACDQAIGRAPDTPGGSRAALAAPPLYVSRPLPSVVPAAPLSELPTVAAAPAVLSEPPAAAAAPFSTNGSGWLARPWVRHASVIVLVAALALAGYWLHTRVLKDWRFAPPPEEEEEPPSSTFGRLAPPDPAPVERAHKKRGGGGGGGGSVPSETGARSVKRPRIPTFAAPRVRFASSPPSNDAEEGVPLPPHPETEASSSSEVTEAADPNFTPL